MLQRALPKVIRCSTSLRISTWHMVYSGPKVSGRRGGGGFPVWFITSQPFRNVFLWVFQIRHLIRTFKFGGGVMEARLRAALWAAVLVRWATSVDVKLYSRWDRSRNVRERRESESRPRQRPSIHCSSIRTGTLPISQLVITAVVAVHAVGTSLPLYRWKESAKWRHVSAARFWMHVHKWVKSDQERARSTSQQNLIKLLSYSSLLFGCYDILFASSWSLYFCRWQAGCCRFSTVWARRKTMDRFLCVLLSLGTDFTNVCVSLLHRQAGLMQRSSLER